MRHLFVPAERKIPKIRIETRQYKVLSKQRIIVAIDSWPRNARYPLGHFVRALGKIGDKETENEVILLEHDIPHSRFSDAVLSSLPKMPWTITDVVRTTNARETNYKMGLSEPFRFTGLGTERGSKTLGCMFGRSTGLHGYRRCPSLQRIAGWQLRSGCTYCRCNALR